MAPASTLDLEQSSLQQQTSNQQKHTVYLIDPYHPEAVQHGREVFNLITPADKECKNWRENATAILMKSSFMNAEDIAKAPKLIAIGKQGVGIDRIDQDACAARGIKILNTPGANARAVAELVLALTMAVARQIRSITTRQMVGPVNKETCSGLSLYRKRLGVIGMGHIGRTVAEIFRGAFDAEIIAYDPFLPRDAWAHIPHQRAESVEEVIRDCDVLTIHVPLTAATRDLISYEQLRTMKSTAILINAARGGIVNEADLSRALSEGVIWGAGLDCHEEEPPTRERYHDLWKNLNVVSTPHIGAATADAQLATATAAIDNLHAHLMSLQS
jgi:phosphoglycerate dehydrogenase-like enzyme